MAHSRRAAEDLISDSLAKFSSGLSKRNHWTMTEKLDDSMDQRLAELNKAKQRFDEMYRPSIPKIQRVPILLRQNARFAKYCTPRMISFGPIHHGNETLKQGEHHKLLWTSKFVEKYRNENRDTAQILLKKIEDNIKELKDQFAEDAILGTEYNDKRLAWMLFVDGCSLLYFMENIDQEHPEALNLKLDQLVCMWRDTIMLENQLPRRLLEMLSKKQGADLEYLFSNMFGLGDTKRIQSVIVSIQNRKPIHVLNFARSLYLSPVKFMSIEDTYNHQMDVDNTNRIPSRQQDHDGDEDNNQIDLNGWPTYKNIQDLKRAGIQVRPNLQDGNGGERIWNNVHFTSRWFSGELRLPIFVFNDITTYFFRNLVAYEMCPDVPSKYECCSFFSFMDSLIDTAEDVKELRLNGVFQNLLGSDEHLANFFNELGDDLPTKMYCDNHNVSTDVVAFSKKYIAVKHQIQKHYRTRWKTWLAEVYNTHFNTPWAMIAFLAASLALTLTFIQTWFAIHPK